MTDDFAYDLPSGGHSAPIASRDERAGLLIVTDNDRDEHLESVAAAAGLRLLGIVNHAAAPQRLDAQILCDAVLVFCTRPTPTLERLLVQVETQAIQNGIAVILVAGWETVELAYACLRGPYSQLLCDPDRAELAAALVAAADMHAPADLVHELDRESLRLQQLSEEVGRLARTIDALTQRARATASPSLDLPPRISDRSSDYIGMPSLAPLGRTQQEDGPEVTAGQVRDLLRARRLRADFLPGDLFADPAWDMLLDLLAARLDHERVSVSSLCIAAAVPPTTALRHIKTLTDKGLVERQADPHDGRRVFIALAQEAADAMTRWFGASRRLLAS